MKKSQRTGGSKGVRGQPVIHVWVFQQDKLHQQDVEIPDDLRHVNLFTSARQRQRWLGSRSAIRKILEEWHGIPACRLKFRRGRHGKPKLREPFGLVHFSVSYSAGLCAIALSDHAPVGIDIEVVREMPDAHMIVNQFFEPSEAAEILSLNDFDRHRTFFRSWVRKEALFKAHGIGLGYPPPWPQVATSSATRRRLMRLPVFDDDVRYQVFDIDMNAAFAMSVAIMSSCNCEVDVCDSWP